MSKAVPSIKFIITLSLLLSFTLCGGNLFAETFRWVDEKGVMHFTDREPPRKALIPDEEAPEEVPEVISDELPANLPKTLAEKPLPEKKVSRKRLHQKVKKKKLYDIRDKVVAVIGVDMIRLKSGKTVKYIGIEDPFDYLVSIDEGRRIEDARHFHEKLVKGKTVTVLFGKKRKDKKGRYLGHVFLGQEAFINAELLRQGYAITEPFPSDFEYQSLFIRLLRDAQNRGVGIWEF